MALNRSVADLDGDALVVLFKRRARGNRLVPTNLSSQATDHEYQRITRNFARQVNNLVREYKILAVLIRLFQRQRFPSSAITIVPSLFFVVIIGPASNILDLFLESRQTLLLLLPLFLNSCSFLVTLLLIVAISIRPTRIIFTHSISNKILSP